MKPIPLRIAHTLRCYESFKVNKINQPFPFWFIWVRSDHFRKEKIHQCHFQFVSIACHQRRLGWFGRKAITSPRRLRSTVMNDSDARDAKRPGQAFQRTRRNLRPLYYFYQLVSAAWLLPERTAVHHMKYLPQWPLWQAFLFSLSLFISPARNTGTRNRSEYPKSYRLDTFKNRETPSVITKSPITNIYNQSRRVNLTELN